MQSISLYLEKFKNLGVSERMAKQSVAKAIQSSIGAVIPETDITFQNGTVFIKAPPAVRSELLLKKESIVKSLEHETRGIKIQDVR